MSGASRDPDDAPSPSPRVVAADGDATRGPGTPADVAAERSRLRWRCRRGMRELDQAMRAYLDHHFDDATDGEREAFRDLLEMQDPELYRHVCGKDRDVRFGPIIDKIARTLGGDAHGDDPSVARS